MKSSRLPVLILKTFLAIAVFLGVACLMTGVYDASPPRRPRPVRPMPAAPGDPGLLIRLDCQGEGPQKSSGPPVAPARPLSDVDVQRILARLPVLPNPEGDRQAFAMRPRSLPAPRTGRTIDTPFPPAHKPGAGQPQVVSGPLEVLRHAPEGPVPLAPSIDVTFSQPMVPVTSVEDANAGTVPVRLTPQPAGRWRWVGAKTLVFQPAGRLPMATTYQVEVPAGTKSAVGGTLKTATRWTFTTPPPQLKHSAPSSGPHRLDPVMLAVFDQRIDPAAVLKTIHVSAGSVKSVPIRLATDREVASDATVAAITKGAEPGRWVAFRATGPLPGASDVTVTIGPGTPSLEGPNTTKSPQAFRFHTYGPLKVVEHRCGYSDCEPLQAWSVRFSNPLDAAAFKPSMVKVSPAVESLKVSASGAYMSIQGRTKGRTKYMVTLDPAIRDAFGQTLGSTPPLAFAVGSASPSLSSTGGQFVVADPDGSPSYSVFSINHKALRVQIRAVGPEDLTTFLKSLNDYSDKVPPLPGRLVSDTVIQPKANPDELVETRIDLAPALKGRFGQVVIKVEPTVQPKERWRRQKVAAWIQVTRIGLDAFADPKELVAWATSLKDGKPLSGVELSIWPKGSRAQSGADGVARMPLPERAPEQPNMLVARLGDDISILPESLYNYYSSGGWYRRPEIDSLRWMVFDDRKMYKPGEEVHVKGWIRRVGAGPRGDIGALDGAARGVTYVVVDSRGNEVLKGQQPLDALGGFTATFKLPSTMNLGQARLTLDATQTSGVSNTEHTHTFEVQEFRRPEFEVSSSSSEGPHFVGGRASVTLSAAYYAGGGLPNAPVSWTVTSTPGWFTPPGRGDYTFGRWRAWWMSWSAEPSRSLSFSNRTDGAGKAVIGMNFDSATPPRAHSVKVEGSVMDVNRQAWATESSLLVHPADHYVGLRSPRAFVQQGQPLDVDVIVTDLDGKALVGRTVQMKAVLLDWTYQNGAYKEVEANPVETQVVSKGDAVRWTFHPKEGGRYRVTATITDDKKRPNESELNLWVAGGKTPPQRNVEQETVTMIPDREKYRPGETAEILVQAPFYPAQGLLTLRRSGLVRHESFTMSGPSTTLKVPIEEAFLPNVHVQVDLVGTQVRTRDDGQVDARLPRRPAFAVGSLNLSVPPLDRTLALKVAPDRTALEPGAQTSVRVQVLDAKGAPVPGGQVAVVVVDEAVLALTGYRVPDPVALFYAQRSGDTSDYHSRQNVVLARPEETPVMQSNIPPPAPSAVPAPGDARRNGLGGAQPKRASYKAKGEADEPQPAIQVRTDFNALATFAAALPTDASGTATVSFKVPDNLTRYRIMAVAVANGRRFGHGDASMTARLPLMVRPSAPRFLNFGDRCELPVVLQNQTDAPMQVQVAMRATNAKLLEGAGRTVLVPANDRVEVRFPTAADQAGKARFQVGAVSGKVADAAEFTLPVWTPATTEAFATYGQLDQGAVVQPVKAPSNVFPQFGGLEITTSSTALQALTDAVLYLQAYPFECSEQISSRVLSVAALRDVLTAFRAEGLPPAKDMVAAMARDIERLKGMQRYDGGFGFWRTDEPDWPYLGIHVAHALARARLKGFTVPNEMFDRSKSYLRNIESHIPSWYGPECRRAIIAYALYVRKWMGEGDVAKARAIFREAGGPGGMGVEGSGWLLAVLSGQKGAETEVTAIRRYLLNRVTETAAAAHFAAEYGDRAYLLLYSNRRADAVVLESMIADQPKSDLIPKIVTGLLAHRVRGRWGNTQENVFVLLALDRYFNTYEKITPDFVARVWLGDGYAGDHTFKGRSTDRQNIDIPMSWLAGLKEGQHPLTIDKQGAGRLYYRIGMRYAPTDLALKPLDEGFTVQRIYEALDDPKDVRRDADGAWHLKAGARIRVKLTMVAPTRRYHVALVDPLPAGLEAMNPALAVTGSVPQDPREAQSRGPWWWFMSPWYEHQNLRDERAEAFASLVWAGVHSYSYVARATTPGQFVVPPPKAEEMYHPETFGRGASDRVIVE